MRDEHDSDARAPHGLPRRTLLTAGAAAAATAWIPAGEAHATGRDLPSGFPAAIPLRRQLFRNWSGETVLDDVWTAVPRTPADVVALANWAHANGWRVRARGKSHTWSPVLLPKGADTRRIVLADTTAHLTAVHVGPGTVTAQAGATMDTLLAALEEAGYGLAAAPAPGDLTLGGVLAIGAHGTAVPAVGEQPPAGARFGSLSNLVTSLTAVVWDASRRRYGLRTFDRSEADIGAFLVHLGRAFVVSATLRTATRTRLRCQSLLDVPVTELFGPPGSGGRTVESYLAGTGRLEAIWFPFTDTPWLKIWSVEPVRPLTSVPLVGPYPYVFANTVPRPVSTAIRTIVNGGAAGTPAFTAGEISSVAAGLTATGTWDVWGWAKDTQLYVKPTTLRIADAGWAVLTARSEAQRVVHAFHTRYQALLDAYRARGAFPVNGPVEVRVTGTDTTAPGEAAPLLSAARPRADRPGWDTVVWLNVASFPGTPGYPSFCRDLEEGLRADFDGSSAQLRPEWSKEWAFTASGAWSDGAALGGWIPAAFQDGFAAARRVLDAHDPARVFGNTFLDRLLP